MKGKEQKMKTKEQSPVGEHFEAKKETAQTESLNLEVEVLEERIAPFGPSCFGPGGPRV